MKYGMIARKIFQSRKMNVAFDVYCTRRSTSETLSALVSVNMANNGSLFDAFNRCMIFIKM